MEEGRAGGIMGGENGERKGGRGDEEVEEVGREDRRERGRVRGVEEERKCGWRMEEGGGSGLQWLTRVVGEGRGHAEEVEESVGAAWRKPPPLERVPELEKVGVPQLPCL